MMGWARLWMICAVTGWPALDAESYFAKPERKGHSATARFRQNTSAFAAIFTGVSVHNIPQETRTPRPRIVMHPITSLVPRKPLTNESPAEGSPTSKSGVRIADDGAGATLHFTLQK
jgi:hypothetical protein